MIFLLHRRYATTSGKNPTNIVHTVKNMRKVTPGTTYSKKHFLLDNSKFSSSDWGALTIEPLSITATYATIGDTIENASLFRVPKVRAWGGKALFLLWTLLQEKSLMNRNRKNIQKFQLLVNCFTFQHNEALTEFKRHKGRYRFLFTEITYEIGSERIIILYIVNYKGWKSSP